MKNQNTEFQAASGYANDKTVYIVRKMTFEEALDAFRLGHVNVLDHSREVRRVKVNGAVKTWKTRPGNCEIPFKYGLYEFGRIVYECGEVQMGSVIPVVVTGEVSA